jgi:hypothetical protein
MIQDDRIHLLVILALSQVAIRGIAMMTGGLFLESVCDQDPVIETVRVVFRWKG